MPPAVAQLRELVEVGGDVLVSGEPGEQLDPLRGRNSGCREVTITAQPGSGGIVPRAARGPDTADEGASVAQVRAPASGRPYAGDVVVARGREHPSGPQRRAVDVGRLGERAGLRSRFNRNGSDCYA
ncbi:hypothetical protein [Microbispora catharanthi]|uniref:Uncharacterized protein n=1 Tax=Microbispora catharanthi TaxID=1712871 RepID=A0A5N6AYE1_9ACTN|nr:hypothetical protein [Microbispora catharanthi]KAB8173797.1 hypothetical protein FH610_041215 [Microbispora catharanthi]